MTFTHPQVRCPIHGNPAAIVVEYRTPIRPANIDYETHHLLACGDPADPNGDCYAEMTAIAELVGHPAGAYPLTRRDAEVITGLDLATAS